MIGEKIHAHSPFWLLRNLPSPAEGDPDGDPGLAKASRAIQAPVDRQTAPGRDWKVSVTHGSKITARSSKLVPPVT